MILFVRHVVEHEDVWSSVDGVVDSLHLLLLLWTLMLSSFNLYAYRRLISFNLFLYYSFYYIYWNLFYNKLFSLKNKKSLLHLRELGILFRLLRRFFRLLDSRANLPDVHHLRSQLLVRLEGFHFIRNRNHLNRTRLLLLHRHNSTLVLRGSRDRSLVRIAVLRLRVLAREEDQVGHVRLQSLNVRRQRFLRSVLSPVVDANTDGRGELFRDTSRFQLFKRETSAESLLKVVSLRRALDRRSQSTRDWAREGSLRFLLACCLVGVQKERR